MFLSSLGNLRTWPEYLESNEAPPTEFSPSVLIAFHALSPSIPVCSPGEHLVIHPSPPKQNPSSIYYPPLNYFHAMFGLLLLHMRSSFVTTSFSRNLQYCELPRARFINMTPGTPSPDAFDTLAKNTRPSCKHHS